VASVTDIEGMVPLHHIVQAICDGKIPYDDGITVIKMLCDADSTMVHKADKQSNTPIDVVQQSRCSSTSICSKERLIQLYQYLRSIRFAVYRQKRSRWEAEGFDQELQDQSRSNDCSDLSVTPLHNELITPLIRVVEAQHRRLASNSSIYSTTCFETPPMYRTTVSILMALV